MAAPSVSIPLFAGDGSSDLPFSTAWGGAFEAEYGFHARFPLALRLGAAYSNGGLRPSGGVTVSGRLSEARLLAGMGLGFTLSPALSLWGFLDGGFVYGSLSSGVNAAYAAAKAGAGLKYKIADDLFARLDVDSLYQFGLYGGIEASIGLGYTLPARTLSSQPEKIRLLEVESITVKSVFPVLRSYYDLNPLGKATLVNTGKEAALNVRVRFLMKQYMDAPKECAVVPRIDPGTSIDVPLYALFNDRVLDVTEATKVSGELSLEYGAGGSLSRTATVLVYDRNALTWDDDRKAAAFVSSKDPWVLDLAGNIMAAVKSSRNPELGKNLQTAIAVHEGLKVYGIGYMVSTTRPFAQAVIDPEVVDTLKFPRQTLGYRAGDCADLSVLYASCLEAAGVETAFVTVPGHIFLAIDLGFSLDEARARSMDESELIVKDGRIWLPLEVTMRDAAFLDIWKTAAAEWRSAAARSLAALYPLHEAWQVFAPMGLPADGSKVATPPEEPIVAGFKSEIAKLVDLELRSRIAALGGIQKGAGAAKSLNSRGVLYAKYGRLAEAERDFSAAAKEQFVPAIVNLGSIAMMKSDPAAAVASYQKAAALSPGNAMLLANLAKAAAALGKSDLVAATLESLRKIDPQAADRFSRHAQIGGAAGTRAAEIDATDLLWL